ncbi:hypothetical protein [Streptomyces sp. NPDC053431]|uniref:hypothetical protein n=1 Tax=Streptomyces sp. NPDC053431 TaxID=3365703 RepID=UPI0037D7797A
MTRHPSITALALLFAVGLALAGCSKTTNDANKEDPAAAAVAIAREYQQAALAQDWRKMCELRTERMRYGTVEQCTADNTPSSEAATRSTPTSASPTTTFDPPTYADASTMPPLPSKTAASGPDRASTGPVKTEGTPIEVPAAGEHPAGWGVMLTYIVTWPSQTTTSRKALRVVQEAGMWRVDQHEDVQDGDMVQGNPIRNSLFGELRP